MMRPAQYQEMVEKLERSVTALNKHVLKMRQAGLTVGLEACRGSSFDSAGAPAVVTASVKQHISDGLPKIKQRER